MTAAVEKVLSDVKPGFSGLLFTKKDVSALSYTEIEKEILKLLIKSKMLNREEF